MFLPLTKNEKFWDKNKKLLFIEDIFWMNKEPKELQRYSYDIFDVDFHELNVNEREFHAFVAQLAEAAGETLNKYHKVSFSHTYWKAILYIWMRNFTPSVYLRVLRLLALREKFGEEQFETTVLAANTWQRPLLNAEELETIDGDFADLYGWHLYSRILKYESLDIEQNPVFLETTFFSKHEETQQPIQSSKLKRYAKRILHKLRNPRELIEWGGRLYTKVKILSNRKADNVEVVVSDFGSGRFLLNLEAKSKGKIVGFSSDEPIWIQHVTRVPEIQWEFRNTAADLLKSRVKTDAPWKRVLCQMFFEEMPCSYIENFELCREVYRPRYEPFPQLKYIISSAGASFTESKMAMAEQRERGVAFSSIVHGCARPSENFRFWSGCVFSDVYYSWGLCEENVKKNIINYRNVPAEKLYMYESMLRVGGLDILYIGDWVHAVLHKHDYHTLGHVLQSEKSFLGCLDERVRKNVLVRNYPLPITSILDRWLKYAFPDIRLSREDEKESFKDRTFAEILLQSRLCIFDHYETPFLEALYINKPLILYIDEDCVNYYFDPDTEQSYVDMMRSVGIIQYDPEAAAKYLNEIYPRIEDWWAEPERQRVVQLVKDRYIGSYTDPEAWWYQEIMGLLSGETRW